MMALGPYIVHAAWLPSGSIFLWANRAKGGAVDAGDLKAMLFAWHAPSFYGTFVDTYEYAGKEGVRLSPQEALDYFSATGQLQHVFLQWSEDSETLIRTAPYIREALDRFQVMPDFDQWRMGKIGWKLSLPEQVPGIGSALVQEWTQALVNQRVSQHPEWRAKLDRLEQAFPRMREQARGLFLDEDDWLVSVGWKPDPDPFRTCLQLIEPADGRNWTLQVLLQDRDNPDRLFPWQPNADPADVPLPEAWKGSLGRIRRDIERWLILLPWLNSGRQDEPLKTSLTHDEAWEFLAHGSLRLVEAGTTVFLPAWWNRVRQAKPRLKARLKSSVGSLAQSNLNLARWTDFDWKLSIGDMELTDDEFRQIMEEKRRLVEFRGRWIQLEPAQLQQIQQIMKQVRRRHGFSLRDLMEMQATLEPGPAEENSPEQEAEAVRLEIELTDQLRQLLARLNAHQGVPLVSAPAGFRGTLRPYQLEGVSWLLFLRQFGLGGCLADDMGLGKTIQWICYLLAVKEGNGQAAGGSDTGAKHRPSLLICPTSVLGNWQKEMERFAPSLRLYVHYGTNRLRGEAFFKQARLADVVLTSYHLAQLDQGELRMVEWDSICLDEAQNIKNAYTKQAAVVKQLEAFHRMAMTGTPIENRLTELWSIFDFLNPGYLGSLREFTRRYVQPIERSRDPQLIAQVQRLIRPFLLRRVKTDPAIQLDLPEKEESKLYVPLTAEQASLYETIVGELFNRIDQAGSMQRRGLILSTLTRLKQLCNHPALLLKEREPIRWRNRSGKLERLVEMVGQIRQEGGKCLVFTQFVETGRMLQQVLGQTLDEKVEFLHGGTPKPERDRMIEAFQSSLHAESGENGVLILSLKAGGIGLNLTAANHVFHFDRWWNPAVENQATDRTYRIGQTRHVQVYKFVTLGTLEERIDEMIELKTGLSRQIVGGGETWLTELSTSELKDIFSLRQEWVAE